MNAYQIVHDYNRDHLDVVALIDPRLGIEWTYKELLEDIESHALTMSKKLSRGDALRFEGLWTTEMIIDYLAAEKNGINSVVVPSPLIPAPQEVVGYKKGGATILFTSGTTGVPKGIVQTADRFVNTQNKLDRTPHAPKIGVGERVGFSLPPVPAGLLDMMRTFMSGGTLVILQGLTSEQLWAAVSEQEIAHITMVTSIAAKLIKLPNINLSKLHWVYLVGEPILPKPLKLLNKQLLRYGCEHRAKLVYGSSEDGLPLAVTLDDADEVEYKPIEGVRCRITNKDENGLGILEVYSDGIQMNKYYNNPIKTSEHYLSDGWARTEDIASEIGEGLIAPHGRIIKRFSDDKLIFIAEKNIADLDGVFDVEILPNGSSSYKAHIILEDGFEKNQVEDKLKLAISKYPGLNDIQFWDWFPTSPASFKRDTRIMSAT